MVDWSLPSVDRRHSWALIIFGFVFVHGAVMQVRGPILPSLQSTFGMSESALGLVGPFATTGSVLAILVGGLRAGRLDMKRLLVVAAGLAGVVTSAVAFAPNVLVLLVCFGLQGTAIGLFRAFDRPLLGHMFPDSRSRVFSYYTAIWAVGAATGPLLTNLVVRSYSWRGVLLLFVPVFFVFALLVHRLGDPPVVSIERSLPQTELGQFLRRPAVLTTVGLVVLSGSIEGIIYTWFPYFARTFTTRTSANSLLTFYFLAYIPGRLAFGTILEYVDNLRLVLALSILSLPALYFTVVVTSHVAVGISVAGLLVSGFFPTLLAFGVNQAPERSGPLNAVATGASLAGVTLSPVVVGLVASTYGIALAMRATVVLAGFLVISTFVTIHLFD